MNFEVLDSHRVYSGATLQLAVDDIKSSESGVTSKREVVSKDGFGMVIPLASDGDIVCTELFHYPHRQMEISFPMVSMNKGEDPESIMRVELEKQLGFRAGRLVKLAEIHELPECACSVGHLYVAEDLRPVPKQRGADEATRTVVRHTELELRKKVRKGSIRSATVIAALHHLLDFQERRRITRSSAAENTDGTWGCPLFPWLPALPLRPSRGKLLMAMFAAVLAFLLLGRSPRARLSQARLLLGVRSCKQNRQQGLSVCPFSGSS